MPKSTNDLDEKSKETWDRSYNVTVMPNLWGEAPVPFVTEAIRIFRADGGRKYLELPCGDGRNTIPLAKELPILIAADTSPNALRINSFRLRAFGLDNCILQKSDIFETQFVDNDFDGIFCCDVLGHLKDVSSAISELLRVSDHSKPIMANVFALGDSTRADSMRKIGPEEYIYADKFYFKYYERADVVKLLDRFPIDIVSIELVKWTEPPHEGYREYSHEHQSWLFVIRKKKGHTL